MHLADFYHRHRIHRLAGHSDFRLFELAIWLHTIAETLIWVFVPIILLTIGYSITEILVYSLIFNIIDVPMNFGVDRLVRKIGARKSLIIGTFGIIAYFCVLGFLSPGNWPALLALAFLGAVYDTFFWVSHLYLLFEINKEGHLDASKTTGAMEGVRKIANIIGPAIGAAVLIVFGKGYLAAAAIFFFALSMVPLYRMRHIRDIPSHEKKLSFKEFFSDPKERSEYASLALYGIHGEVNSGIWPIFVFVTIGSIESVAAIPIVMSIATTVFAYVAGKLTKRFASKMIALGSLLIALTWILRLSFQDNILYFISVFLIGLFSLFVIIPIDSGIAESGMRKGALSASLYRNVISMGLRIPLYAVLILLVHVFEASFGLAAGSVFVVFVIALMAFRGKGAPRLV